jgi:hypothetical protein
MSLRFRRRVKLLPGVTLNLGLHGAGVSIGPRGHHVGLNRRGMYTSAGIPGSGIYAVHHFHGHGEPHSEVRGGGSGNAAGCLILALLLFVGWLVSLIVHS